MIRGRIDVVSRVLLAGLVLALSCAVARAQAGNEKLRTWLSSGVVRLGDRVTLMVSVEDARTAEIGALPQVPGLQFGPVQELSPRISIVPDGSGRRTQTLSRTWAIALRPGAVGQYAIPPFDVSIDGQAVRTSELAFNVVADMKGEELGFFEMHASASKVIVGQPFSLELVFGFDQALSDSVGYCDLALSWWNRLPGLLENALPKDGANQHVRVTLNSREQIEVEVAATRTLRGRPFVTLRLQRSFTPTRTGKLEIPTSFFEFGELVGGAGFFSNPRKGQTYFARASELSIEVVPLPEQGRPLEFSGAIGTFSVRADATPRDVDAGESIKLQVEWTGTGNLEFFTAPEPARLDAFREFRVYGKTERKSFERRTVEYDLAPISSAVREIPPLPLTVFDPDAARYTTLATEALPIRVRALAGAAALSGDGDAESFETDIRDVVLAPGPLRVPRPLGALALLGALAALPAGWLALRAFARRHFDPDAPAERARRRARRRLAKELARSTDARATLDALHGFLAARSGESREAWIGRSVSDHVRGEPQAARELEGVIAELEASVWGGSPAAPARERVLRAADEAVRGGL